MSQIKCISMWRPWANWVRLGWKTTETRLHSRFAGLVGQRIGIHAALKWDENALVTASPFLDEQQMEKSQSNIFMDESNAHKGAIICTATVWAVKWLEITNSYSSLIECETPRYGLFLKDIEPLEVPHFCKGRQGIWTEDIPSAQPEQGGQG